MSSSIAKSSRPCIVCGYELRGTPSDRCPECGQAFDRALSEPMTPWLRPGGWRVVRFWHTVWRATVRPKSIADDVAHPAALVAAFRFRRWLTIWLSVWPVLIGALLYLDDVYPGLRGQSLLRAWFGSFGSNRRFSHHWTWYVEVICVGIVLASVPLWIFLTQGVASYLCHPRRLSVERQDRAIALSYFGAAPLAWMPLFAFVALAIEWRVSAHAGLYAFRLPDAQTPYMLVPFVPTQASRNVEAIAGGLMLLPFLFMLRATAAIVRRSTARGIGRGFAALALIAVAWPLLFALFPAAIAMALFWLQLIAYSLAP